MCFLVVYSVVWALNEGGDASQALSLFPSFFPEGTNIKEIKS